MNGRLVVAALVPALSLACASTKLSPGGAEVKVYETDRRSGAPESTLPAGCRMLSASAPFRQQEGERVNVKDPYRADRNATADRGGNVLLVRSSRIIDLKKTECPTTDRSPDCQSTVQSWYDVTLESYACDAPALAVLSGVSAPPGRAFWWPFGETAKKAATSPAPAAPASQAPATPGLSSAELKAKLLALAQEGVGADVQVAYVKSQRVASPLTAEEIVDWKRSGIAEPVIEAAVARGSVH
jgi:hypothetical protein